MPAAPAPRTEAIAITEGLLFLKRNVSVPRQELCSLSTAPAEPVRPRGAQECKMQPPVRGGGRKR